MLEIAPIPDPLRYFPTAEPVPRYPVSIVSLGEISRDQAQGVVDTRSYEFHRLVT